MHFDLVSPEKSVASIEVDAVDLPGVEGDMTAMDGHLPMLTSLRPGFVKARAGGDESRFVVAGGFVEITADSVTVLADEVFPEEEFTTSVLDDLVSRLEETASTKEMQEKDKAEKRLGDAISLRSQISH
ncbi:MAG: ATP synthase F1 subunit epsilon [Rhodobacteraceae bacterium]|nr:ATP synthase F1 subunit epsilon [Paracoccaceae bacterium]MDE2738227.1 ATP synthase F1 subunit epsilon [Paracoccaceae bacterium]